MRSNQLCVLFVTAGYCPAFLPITFSVIDAIKIAGDG